MRCYAYRRSPVALVALGARALAVCCGVAHAQTPPPISEDAIVEVVVTGSRIPIANDVAISPVTEVSSAIIEQTGVTRIEDLLNSLPQVFADQGSTVSNGADGTAAVNLRGFGAGRTLVLVNGRRLGPGDPQGGGQSDLNEIPVELINSIEILTGGASSVYGADAVAGVVNFKLIDHFQGVKVTANYGFYNHTNENTEGVNDAISSANFPLAPTHVNTGNMKDLSILAGLDAPDGKGNATFYATYRNEGAVLQSHYSYSACALAPGYLAGPNANGGKLQCAGSLTAYPGNFATVDPASGQLGPMQALGPHGDLIPFSNADLYNFGPLNYFQRPDERYTGGALLHYEFNEHATAYSETQFMKDRTVAQIAPSGVFFGAAAYPINCNNPELSVSMIANWCGGSTAGNALLLIGRRDVESGGRLDDIEHTSWREVVGARGKLDDVWQYDVSAQYSNVHRSEELYNDLSINKVNNALSVVNYNSSTGTVGGAGGAPACTSALPGSFNNVYPNAGTDASCVPWNIFQIGGVNSKPSTYLQALLTSQGEVTQQILATNFTGDLGKYGVQVPAATAGVKVNVGAEWREVKSSYDPNLEYQTGDAEGIGTPILPVSGAIVAREAFAEAHVPIVSERPWAKSLNFDTGYRFSNYGPGFNTNTYKFGLEWTPVRDFRLRSSWSRAVRAPNVGERFSSQSVAGDGGTDPCSGSKPQYSSALCARTGVTPAEYGNISPSPTETYNGLTGSNPLLQPETATTVSFGAGWNPSSLRGFRAQADYYDIRIVNVIQQIGADTILRQCLTSDLFCNLIRRDQFGSLWLTPHGYVVDTLANVGELEQKGIDADLSYDFAAGSYGEVLLSLVGTYLIDDVTEPIQALASSRYDCAGYYGTICAQPKFKWRHTSRITWETPWRKLQVSLAWRYFGPVTLDALSSNPNLAAPAGLTVANGGISNTDARLSSRSYIDVSAALQLSGAVAFRVGINNLLDKDPPVIGDADGAFNGNTYPQIYDSLGRYIFGTLIARF
jgi:outer membrane receptor protein involved in Fe transport